MPVALPATETEKAVPSSMEELSPVAAAEAGSSGPNSDCSAPLGSEVVNCQLSGASTAPCAETTSPRVAVIRVADGSGCAGVKVIVRASAERAEVPATAAPLADSPNVKPAWTGADNVTDGFDVSGKPRESVSGTCDVTVSGGTETTKSTSTR